MTADKRFPTPEQIHAWLGAHGWTPESPIPADPEDGLDFFSAELADDGEPFMVCAPQTVETPLYGIVVQAVVTTAAGLEGRPKAEVLAEMLAGEPPRPAAPVARVPTQSPAPAPTSD